MDHCRLRTFYYTLTHYQYEKEAAATLWETKGDNRFANK